MSEYADNYMTDEKNVRWVKMDYVNPIMKKDDLAMSKLEADNRELTAKVKEQADLLIECSTVLLENNFRGDLQDSISDLINHQ
jgi:hypothetical protein